MWKSHIIIEENCSKWQEQKLVGKKRPQQIKHYMEVIFTLKLAQSVVKKVGLAVLLLIQP